MPEEPNLNTETHCAVDVQLLDDFSSEVDLVAIGPTGKAPREVILLGAGIFEFTTKFGTRTIEATEAAYLIGKSLVWGILTITSNTTITKLTVAW